MAFPDASQHINSGIRCQIRSRQSGIDVSTPTRVLVVDDDRALANCLATILELSAFEVQTAYSGEGAVTVAGIFLPDLLITDFSMPPGMNGIEAAFRIKKMAPACRVMVLSGHFLEKEFTNYQGHNFRLLPKPMTPEDILAAVREEANTA
jgi:CheY-like chemotaxis protein